jgi:hypothetical protein
MRKPQVEIMIQRNTSTLTDVPCGFTWFLNANVRKATEIKKWILALISFRIHYSLTTP